MSRQRHTIIEIAFSANNIFRVSQLSQSRQEFPYSNLCDITQHDTKQFYHILVWYVLNHYHNYILPRPYQATLRINNYRSQAAPYCCVPSFSHSTLPTYAN